ncbi:MAG: GNAT family N-acetyltransferase [Terracidiphilus sp.]|nr:GNAT family N-acetyltransferase [Terracidiphilus sp.]
MNATYAKGVAAHSHVTLANTMQSVALLRSNWQQLSAIARPNIFQSFAWYSAWSEHLIADDPQPRLEPWVLALRNNIDIVGISPLVRRTVIRGGWHVRKLEFVTPHADYNELTLGKEPIELNEVILASLAETSREWELLDLMDLRNDCGQADQLAQAVKDAGLSFRVFDEQAGCLYMPIDGPWIEMRTRKHLRFARRAWAALEERACEGYRVRVIDEPHYEPGLLDRMIKVEAQKRVNGKLAKPVIGAFRDVFQKLIDELGPSRSIAVVVVEKNDTLIAWRWLYCCGNVLWDYLTAYDHAFGELSPGTLLLCAALDYGFAHGYSEFDFLRGTDAYKLRWTRTYRRNQRVLVWNRRWRSRVAARLFLGIRRNTLASNAG